MTTMSRRFAPLMTVLILVGVATLAQVLLPPSNSYASSAGSRESAVPGPAVASLGTPSQPVGLPAINPHLQSSGPSTPEFSIADVEAYVATNGVPNTLPGTTEHPAIVSIMFLSSAQVSVKLNGESTGMPDNALLCYVELSGVFVFPGPEEVGSVTYHKAREVFDAHTGNLLLLGGGN